MDCSRAAWTAHRHIRRKRSWARARCWHDCEIYIRGYQHHCAGR
jgi:hypothetical protein